MRVTKKLLALLLCLLLLPLWAMADGSEGARFSLSFAMDASAYPEGVHDIVPGIADLLNVLTADGTLLIQDDRFDLSLDIMLNGLERTRTELRMDGTEQLWNVRSPLLGSETLTISMLELLEFAIKGYTHMDIPFQRVGILLSPYVHTSALSGITDAAKPILFAEEGSRTITKNALDRLADQLAEAADADVRFQYWARALASETGYDSLLMTLPAQLPEWIDSFVPVTGLKVTVDDHSETWTAGPATIARRTTDLSGMQTLSVTLPPLPDGTTFTLDAALQPDGNLLHGSLNLHIADSMDETILRLHADGSLPTSLPVTQPFSMIWDADGPAVGGDGVHLRFEGEATGQTLTLRQLTPDHAATMLTVTATLEPLQGGDITVHDSGIRILNVDFSSLNDLMGRIAGPLIRGMLPLIAQAPASSCQTLMNMLESSGVFDLLTSGFSPEGAGGW